jgi:Leucine-rich repeat (LRR) protein
MDEDLATCTGLEILDLSWNKRITDKGIIPLTNLTELCLDGRKKKITDASISKLTNLRTLTLKGRGLSPCGFL